MSWGTPELLSVPQTQHLPVSGTPQFRSVPQFLFIGLLFSGDNILIKENRKFYCYIADDLQIIYFFRGQACA